MDVTAATTALRENERAALALLREGCSADLASVRRLVAGPLRDARERLTAEITSMGRLEPYARQALLRAYAEGIAMECAREVFANADVRFRARFGIYASALAAASERARSPYRRRITLPHLRIENERDVLPQREIMLDEVDAWVDDLGTRVRAALQNAVNAACRDVARRGLASLARARIALRRADA